MSIKFSNLTVEDFGPYYGIHEVNFGTSKPIVIIHGENMRGKTSLLNSIHWALYGDAQDRFRKKMPLLSLINTDKAEEGDWTMSITLNFKVDKDSYVLIRSVQPKKANSQPFEDKDFSEILHLKKNSRQLNEQQAIAELARIFPKDVARFFLFDGEMLNEYEKLLAKEESQSVLIRDSIEQILGVPTLKNALKDAEKLLGIVSRRQTKLAQKDKKAEIFAKQVAELEVETESLDKDKNQLKITLENYGIEQIKLDEKLSSTAGIEGDAKRLEEIKTRIKYLESRKNEIEEELRENLSTFWLDIISSKVKEKIGELENKQTKLIKSRKKIQIKEHELELLTGLHEKDSCPICKGEVSASQIIDINKRVKKIEDSISRESSFDEKITTLSTSLSALRKINLASNADVVERIETEISRINLDLLDEERKRDTLDLRLREHNTSEVVRNRTSYDENLKEMGAIQIVIDEKIQKIREHEDQISDLREKIGEVSGPELDNLNKEVSIYQGLVSVFKLAINHLVDDLRSSIEADASKIFLKLTTEKTHKGLEINEYYGLKIIDKNNNHVRVRSAGAEQIVALSLIGALNKNAVRQGPIFMDTPFGRLDPTHRANIMKFVPTMANQITLLVHGGEIDRSKDLENIIDRVDREYEIEYISPSRSIIANYEGN